MQGVEDALENGSTSAEGYEKSVRKSGRLLKNAYQRVSCTSIRCRICGALLARRYFDCSFSHVVWLQHTLHNPAAQTLLDEAR